MNIQKKKLQDFDAKLNFEKLNENGLIRFQTFLEDKNHRNSTIAKAISLLKWFLRWAKKKGYNINRDFETFKPKIKSTEKKIIFLNRTELKKLRDYCIPHDKIYLEKIRDVFLF